MMQFVAILMDSFREAMDAKIIYVLLGLSLLLMGVAATISYSPVEPTEAFASILQRFNTVFPDRGRGKIPLGLPPAMTYSAKDIRAVPGGYSLRLEVKPGAGEFSFLGAGGRQNLQGDPLRFAVVNWMKPPGPTRTFMLPSNGGAVPFEVAEPQEASAEELAAVTDEQMQEFIRNQFATHAGVAQATVTRARGIAEPTYAFDVDLKMSDAVRGWPHHTSLFFGALTLPKPLPLGMVLWFIEEKIVNGFGATITLLIGVVITGFFIPNMLRKGALDLIVTKPIGRSALLVYKYLGGLSYMVILTVATVGGIWLVLALRSGFWDPSFLLLIPILTFTFAILYAFSTLVAVLTRSSIAAILLTCGFAFFLFVVGQAKLALDDFRADPKNAGEVHETLAAAIDGLHFILPRYKDVDRLTTKLISDATLTPLEQYAMAKAKADYPKWGETFGFSLGFIAVCLALSCWRFQTRDA
ncbi:MAG TPA: ABC transporter permease subunit [Urbifossiella sp.]|nr:ABC transporter permease subunit [Urbifossiella sp.]